MGNQYVKEGGSSLEGLREHPSISSYSSSHTAQRENHPNVIPSSGEGQVSIPRGFQAGGRARKGGEGINTEGIGVQSQFLIHSSPKGNSKNIVPRELAGAEGLTTGGGCHQKGISTLDSSQYIIKKTIRPDRLNITPDYNVGNDFDCVAHNSGQPKLSPDHTATLYGTSALHHQTGSPSLSSSNTSIASASFRSSGNIPIQPRTVPGLSRTAGGTSPYSQTLNLQKLQTYRDVSETSELSDSKSNAKTFKGELKETSSHKETISPVNSPKHKIKSKMPFFKRGGKAKGKEAGIVSEGATASLVKGIGFPLVISAQSALGTPVSNIQSLQNVPKGQEKMGQQHISENKTGGNLIQKGKEKAVSEEQTKVKSPQSQPWWTFPSRRNTTPNAAIPEEESLQDRRQSSTSSSSYSRRSSATSVGSARTTPNLSKRYQPTSPSIRPRDGVLTRDHANAAIAALLGDKVNSRTSTGYHSVSQSPAVKALRNTPATEKKQFSVRRASGEFGSGPFYQSSGSTSSVSSVGVTEQGTMKTNAINQTQAKTQGMIEKGQKMISPGKQSESKLDAKPSEEFTTASSSMAENTKPPLPKWVQPAQQDILKDIQPIEIKKPVIPEPDENRPPSRALSPVNDQSWLKLSKSRETPSIKTTKPRIVKPGLSRELSLDSGLLSPSSQGPLSPQRPLSPTVKGTERPPLLKSTTVDLAEVAAKCENLAKNAQIQSEVLPSKFTVNSNDSKDLTNTSHVKRNTLEMKRLSVGSSRDSNDLTNVALEIHEGGSPRISKDLTHLARKKSKELSTSPVPPELPSWVKTDQAEGISIRTTKGPKIIKAGQRLSLDLTESTSNVLPGDVKDASSGIGSISAVGAITSQGRDSDKKDDINQENVTQREDKLPQITRTVKENSGPNNDVVNEGKQSVENIKSDMTSSDKSSFGVGDSLPNQPHKESDKEQAGAEKKRQAPWVSTKPTTVPPLPPQNVLDKKSTTEDGKNRQMFTKSPSQSQVLQGKTLLEEKILDKSQAKMNDRQGSIGFEHSKTETQINNDKSDGNQAQKSKDVNAHQEKAVASNTSSVKVNKEMCDDKDGVNCAKAQTVSGDPQVKPQTHTVTAGTQQYGLSQTVVESITLTKPDHTEKRNTPEAEPSFSVNTGFKSKESVAFKTDQSLHREGRLEGQKEGITYKLVSLPETQVNTSSEPLVQVNKPCSTSELSSKVVNSNLLSSQSQLPSQTGKVPQDQIIVENNESRPIADCIKTSQTPSIKPPIKPKPSFLLNKNKNATKSESQCSPSVMPVKGKTLPPQTSLEQKLPEQLKETKGIINQSGQSSSSELKASNAQNLMVKNSNSSSQNQCQPKMTSKSSEKVEINTTERTPTNSSQLKGLIDTSQSQDHRSKNSEYKSNEIELKDQPIVFPEPKPMVSAKDPKELSNIAIGVNTDQKVMVLKEGSASEGLFESKQQAIGSGSNITETLIPNTHTPLQQNVISHNTSLGGTSNLTPKTQVTSDKMGVGGHEKEMGDKLPHAHQIISDSPKNNSMEYVGGTLPDICDKTCDIPGIEFRSGEGAGELSIRSKDFHKVEGEGVGGQVELSFGQGEKQTSSEVKSRHFELSCSMGNNTSQKPPSTNRNTESHIAPDSATNAPSDKTQITLPASPATSARVMGSDISSHVNQPFPQGNKEIMQSTEVQPVKPSPTNTSQSHVITSQAAGNQVGGKNSSGSNAYPQTTVKPASAATSPQPPISTATRPVPPLRGVIKKNPIPLIVFKPADINVKKESVSKVETTASGVSTVIKGGQLPQQQPSGAVSNSNTSKLTSEQSKNSSAIIMTDSAGPDINNSVTGMQLVDNKPHGGTYMIHPSPVGALATCNQSEVKSEKLSPAIASGIDLKSHWETLPNDSTRLSSVNTQLPSSVQQSNDLTPQGTQVSTSGYIFTDLPTGVKGNSGEASSFPQVKMGGEGGKQISQESNSPLLCYSPPAQTPQVYMKGANSEAYQPVPLVQGNTSPLHSALPTSAAQIPTEILSSLPQSNKEGTEVQHGVPHYAIHPPTGNVGNNQSREMVGYISNQSITNESGDISRPPISPSAVSLNYPTSSDNILNQGKTTHQQLKTEYTSQLSGTQLLTHPNASPVADRKENKEDPTSSSLSSGEEGIQVVRVPPQVVSGTGYQEQLLLQHQQQQLYLQQHQQQQKQQLENININNSNNLQQSNIQAISKEKMGLGISTDSEGPAPSPESIPLIKASYNGSSVYQGNLPLSNQQIENASNTVLQNQRGPIPTHNHPQTTVNSKQPASHCFNKQGSDLSSQNLIQPKNVPSLRVHTSPDHLIPIMGQGTPPTAHSPVVSKMVPLPQQATVISVANKDGKGDVKPMDLLTVRCDSVDSAGLSSIDYASSEDTVSLDSMVMANSSNLSHSPVTLGSDIVNINARQLKNSSTTNYISDDQQNLNNKSQIFGQNEKKMQGESGQIIMRGGLQQAPNTVKPVPIVSRRPGPVYPIPKPKPTLTVNTAVGKLEPGVGGLKINSGATMKDPPLSSPEVNISGFEKLTDGNIYTSQLSPGSESSASGKKAKQRFISRDKSESEPDGDISIVPQFPLPQPTPSCIAGRSVLDPSGLTKQMAPLNAAGPYNTTLDGSNNHGNMGNQHVEKSGIIHRPFEPLSHLPLQKPLPSSLPPSVESDLLAKEGSHTQQPIDSIGANSKQRSVEEGEGRVLTSTSGQVQVPAGRGFDYPSLSQATKGQGQLDSDNSTSYQNFVNTGMAAIKQGAKMEYGNIIMHPGLIDHQDSLESISKGNSMKEEKGFELTSAMNVQQDLRSLPDKIKDNTSFSTGENVVVDQQHDMISNLPQTPNVNTSSSIDNRNNTECDSRILKETDFQKHEESYGANNTSSLHVQQGGLLNEQASHIPIKIVNSQNNPPVVQQNALVPIETCIDEMITAHAPIAKTEEIMESSCEEYDSDEYYESFDEQDIEEQNKQVEKEESEKMKNTDASSEQINESVPIVGTDISREPICDVVDEENTICDIPNRVLEKVDQNRDVMSEEKVEQSTDIKEELKESVQDSSSSGDESESDHENQATIKTEEKSKVMDVKSASEKAVTFSPNLATEVEIPAKLETKSDEKDSNDNENDEDWVSAESIQSAFKFRPRPGLPVSKIAKKEEKRAKKALEKKKKKGSDHDKTKKKKDKKNRNKKGKSENVTENCHSPILIPQGDQTNVPLESNTENISSEGAKGGDVQIAAENDQDAFIMDTLDAGVGTSDLPTDKNCGPLWWEICEDEDLLCDGSNTALTLSSIIIVEPHGSSISKSVEEYHHYHQAWWTISKRSVAVQFPERRTVGINVHPAHVVALQCPEKRTVGVTVDMDREESDLSDDEDYGSESSWEEWCDDEWSGEEVFDAENQPVVFMRRSRPRTRDGARKRRGSEGAEGMVQERTKNFKEGVPLEKPRRKHWKVDVKAMGGGVVRSSAYGPTN